MEQKFGKQTARLVLFEMIRTFLFGFLYVYGHATDIDFSKTVPGYFDIDPLLPFEFPSKYGDDDGSRIVGGMESIPNSRPYQAAVYIFFNATHGSFCGGSLINPMTILTAAHCVDNTSLNLTIVLGAHSLPSNPANTTHISTGDIVLHPNWTRSTLMNDIAIVRLPSPVELSDRINTVLLPRDDSHDYLGNTTLVSGWGRPADTVGTISPVLREVSSFVISQHACNLAYLGMIDPSHICISGAYGRGTCNGDSGGPLVVNGVQIGVVSFGITYGCEVGWPPVFARVTSYLDWIAQNSANVTAYYYR